MELIGCTRKIFIQYYYETACMVATKRIPVSQEIWEELNRLKESGQTFDDLLEELLEREKKLKLIKDMKRIEETAEFVEL